MFIIHAKNIDLQIETSTMNSHAWLFYTAVTLILVPVHYIFTL